MARARQGQSTGLFCPYAEKLLPRETFTIERENKLVRHTKAFFELCLIDMKPGLGDNYRLAHIPPRRVVVRMSLRSRVVLVKNRFSVYQKRAASGPWREVAKNETSLEPLLAAAPVMKMLRPYKIDSSSSIMML